jgi:uncharacterized SAM-binding protein YcdF (DUF218 family)
MDLTFLLKKIISMFLMPFSLGMILLLIALILLYKNKLLKAKITFTFGFLWLFMISYPPLVNHILHHFESSYPTLHTPPKDIQHIYVLGAGHHSDDNHPITSQVHQISTVRLNEAIRLYNLLEQKPVIITSGYHGFFNTTSGALMQHKLALALGIHKDKLHMESSTKDTHEEAIAAKKYIGDAPFILVTSASHMKRAIQFFEHEGLHPIPAPTNHLAEVQHPNYAAIFSSRSLYKMTIVWHEILGLTWQKIKGI